VPEALKTEDMCIAAISQTTGALKYAPENLKAGLKSIFMIRLTNDEIDVINAWANGSGDRNEVIEINDTIWKEGKTLFIDNFSQSKLINVSCISDAFFDISHIEFRDNNTKAILYYSEGVGFLSGSGWETHFSKENNIWKHTDTRMLWMS